MTLAKFVRMSAVTAGALAVATQVNAADIYGGLKDAPVYVAAPVWTGFYIGAHLGGAWAGLETKDLDGVWGMPGDTFNNVSPAIIGGGQVGYNYQSGSFVFGAEADFGGIGLSHSQRVMGSFGLVYSTIDSGFYTDVTGRLGYAAGPALFYVKGGWAFYDGNISLHDDGVFAGVFAPSAYSYSASASGVGGWTFGGGIEYKFSPSWGLKGEYRYFDFGNITTANLYPANFWAPGSLANGRFEHSLTANSATVGVNYYIGSVYTPLK